MRLIPLVLLVATCAPVFAERYEFSRYEGILTRQMFGVPPPGFDPQKLPSEVSRSEQKELTKEQEKLQSAIHFSVINITPEGQTMVGFTDNSNAKEPRHYYLKLGDRRDGWLVKDADPAAATMTIEKDGIEVSLSIGGDSSKGGGTTMRAGAQSDLSEPAAAAADSSSTRARVPTMRSRRDLRMSNMEKRFEAKIQEMKQEQERKDREREERQLLADEARKREMDEVIMNHANALSTPKNEDQKPNAESGEGGSSGE